MRQRHDDPIQAEWEPDADPLDTDEVRNFETEVSDNGTDYNSGFDEDMNPLDETEINEHGSER
jgi:hypothetical protein